jgi:chemotaxis signal transduction protein
VGARRCAGYREFRGLGIVALVLSAVGPARTAGTGARAPFTYSHRAVPRAEALDLATVACGPQWLALPATSIVAAIQDARPTRLPGRAAWMLGVVRHGEALVPVVDLALLLGQPGGSAQTIVVAREQDQLIGLAVDELGDVLEVAASDIALIEAASGAQRASVTRGILRPRTPEDTSALMLDLAAVLRELR